MKGDRSLHRIVGLTMVIIISSILHPFTLSAAGEPYLCEVGLQGGCSYYVGDATPHIFQDVRETYGLQFRYKFTKRWAIQVKAATQRIAGHEYNMRMERLETMWENRLITIDAMAEFNFFRFGAKTRFDDRIKPYTPYIFIGIGAGMYQDMNSEGLLVWTAAGYVPLGIGFKWKFHERFGLNIAWQHNIYFSDDIEARKSLNNTHHLNGTNWMNCDLTGQLTAGIVFEFGKAKKPCRVCNF